MTSPAPSDRALGAARAALASPRTANALALTAIGTGIFAGTIHALIGWAGFIAILSGLVVLALGSLLARRGELEWNGLLPVSLLAFVGWASLSIVWSQYQWASLGGIAYLLGFTVLGVSIALTRDTIQIVRAFGDVLRVALGVSIAVEIIAGVLIDTPIPFLGVKGDLASLGPIQGIMGSRNQLGLLALLALVTFGIELATKSIRRDLAIGSLVAAAAVVLLSRSPVSWAVLVVVLFAAAVLALLRRVSAERRAFWQLAVLAGVFALAVLAWLFRVPIITLFSANSELSYRLAVWRRAWELIAVHPLTGWGWVGKWHPEVQPFPAFTIPGQREPASALNAYLDAWFQLGLVGVFVFAVLVVLAFTRSWLLAGQQRSIVFAWPALMLVALLVTALAESSMLVEYGWMLFVVCCVKAARELSWRSAFDAAGPPTEQTDSKSA